MRSDWVSPLNIDMRKILDMKRKLLLFILLLSGIAVAQSAGPSVAERLEAARMEVRAERPEAAIAVLAELAATGFTGVSAITGDATLADLSGMPAYDRLVAELSRKAYPCEYDEAFSAFDFWLGEWDVDLADGTRAGTNIIEKTEHGCLISEHWSGSGGSSGQSINYVDKRTGEWVQIWNSAGGSQIDIRGGLAAGGMQLTGTIHYVGSGQTLPFRGLWTPLADGRVRQFFEQSNDGGENWSPWFEGFYTRRNDAE